MAWVTKNLKIVHQEPGGYQFRGTIEECEAYLDSAQKVYTEDEKRANEISWLVSINGESTLQSCFGDHWLKKLEEKKERRKILRQKRLESQT